MKSLATFFFATLIPVLATGGNLKAASVVLPDLPAGDTDTISIVLDPADGAVHGLPGSTVGWGFSVTWTSTEGDWVSFTGTSLGSPAKGEINPGLAASYSDFIGVQGGPVDFGLSPGTWTEAFDGVSQGVGAYQITDDPGVAVPGAEDTAQLTFDFQVFNGDPLIGTQIGDDSYAYFGDSTAYVVTVDALSTPEPASWQMLLAGGLLSMSGYRKRGLLIRRKS